MIKFYFLLIVGLAGIEATAQVTFQKTIGTAQNESSSSITKTAGGDYIIAGTKTSAQGDDDIYLVKTNTAGSLLWTKSYGGSNTDNCSEMCPTSDGGFILIGSTNSFGAGNYDVCLVKTDSYGNALWVRTYGGSSIEYGYSVQQTNDGGYILCGTTYSFGAGVSDIYIIKTDASGNIIWTKTLGSTSDDEAYSVRQTNDGGYIISGEIRLPLTFACLIKIDGNGNQLWVKTFNNISPYGGYATILKTSDNGFIITGSTTSFGAGDFDTYMIKTDFAGNILWAKTYGGIDTEFGYRTLQTSDDGYLLTGATKSFGSGNFDALLVRTDSVGNLLWSKTYGDLNADFANTTLQTVDNGYLVTGFTYSFGAGMQDIYLIKTDASGNSNCHETSAAMISTNFTDSTTSPALTISTGGSLAVITSVTSGGGAVTTLCSVGIEEPDSVKAISIFPNPSNGLFHFVDLKAESDIEIYDITGQRIYSIRTNNTSCILDISYKAKGLYMYRIYNEDKLVQQGKLSIQ